MRLSNERKILLQGAIILFSFFISMTGKRNFQTGRALAGIIAYYMTFKCITWNSNLLHF